MSRDVYDIIDFREVEHSLIYQCAPVLSGLKMSNLLILDREIVAAALMIIRSVGLSFYVLYRNEKKITFIVFHEDELRRVLREKRNVSFLKKRGYPSGPLQRVMMEAASRYRACMDGKAGFPDELGLFLGYPFEDVIGYIEQNGRNFLLNGYWKVYSDPEAAAERFESYDVITEKMMREVISGKSILRVIRDNRIDVDKKMHSYAG
ncbi:Protein of unknown function [Lachnospiraceae bacterium]|nr:Protein of unknown function [Lachnospiraceae bacterium]